MVLVKSKQMRELMCNNLALVVLAPCAIAGAKMYPTREAIRGLGDLRVERRNECRGPRAGKGTSLLAEPSTAQLFFTPRERQLDCDANCP